MNEIGVALVPLAAFWASFNSLLQAAQFVNTIRDTVVMGTKDSRQIPVRIRKAMRFDWLLSMAGTIVASFLFAGILFWMAGHIGSSGIGVARAVAAVGVFPALSGLLFIVCGINDNRVMQSAIAEAEEAEYTARANKGA